VSIEINDVVGTGKIRAFLEELVREQLGSNLKPRIEVGYDTPYARRVHEDLHVFHRVGQAKFLEQPARELEGEIKKVVKEAVLDGKTLEEALKDGGEFLKRASQELVPVDTGLLKSTAYVEVRG
jgi:hypothetical protein